MLVSVNTYMYILYSNISGRFTLNIARDSTVYMAAVFHCLRIFCLGEV